MWDVDPSESFYLMSFDIMFFQLMQVALGEKACLDRTLSASEWERMLALARKQAVVGLLADAIEALPDGQKAPVGVRMTCASLTIAIERQNVQTNRDCVDITRRFEGRGFRCCILKGQGNALLYPAPLRRQSGHGHRRESHCRAHPLPPRYTQRRYVGGLSLGREHQAAAARLGEKRAGIHLSRISDVSPFSVGDYELFWMARTNIFNRLPKHVPASRPKIFIKSKIRLEGNAMRSSGIYYASVEFQHRFGNRRGRGLRLERQSVGYGAHADF